MSATAKPLLRVASLLLMPGVTVIPHGEGEGGREQQPEAKLEDGGKGNVTLCVTGDRS